MALAKEGATVVVADLDSERTASVAAEIQQMGGKALGIPTDVSKRAPVTRMVEQTVQRLGRVDILVNHAGISPSGKLVEEMPEEAWDRSLTVHLKSAFLCSQAVIPYMKKERWGRIVNTASRTAYQPRVLGVADYAAAKAGIIGFSRALAMEVGRHGITVNCVAPGLVSGSGMAPSPNRPAQSPEARQRAIQGEGQLIQPVRDVTPDEIAGAVLYLVSPSAARVTGTVLHVNGGSYLPA